jgi:hypothetical protein
MVKSLRFQQDGNRYIAIDMGQRVFLSVIFMLFTFHVFAQEVPSELRGGIQADNATIQKALEIKKQGWTYIMPKPKSPQAAWGNRDGRTTWWVGYWINEKTSETSSTEPVLTNSKYIGDSRGSLGWRRGGTPPPPTKIEWLLSKEGGIKPLGN